MTAKTYNPAHARDKTKIKNHRPDPDDGFLVWSWSDIRGRSWIRERFEAWYYGRLIKQNKKNKKDKN